MRLLVTFLIISLLPFNNIHATGKTVPPPNNPTPAQPDQDRHNSAQTLAWILGACIVASIIRGKFCLEETETRPVTDPGSMVPDMPKNEFAKETR
jgi:hypothetical protein